MYGLLTVCARAANERSPIICRWLSCCIAAYPRNRRWITEVVIDVIDDTCRRVGLSAAKDQFVFHDGRWKIRFFAYHVTTAVVPKMTDPRVQAVAISQFTALQQRPYGPMAVQVRGAAHDVGETV